jgi:aryl carrier-like protein
VDDAQTRIDRLSPQRRALLQRLMLDGGGDLPPPAPALQPLVDRLRAIWAEVLGTEVGIHNNYFELGGDSILSVTIVAKAQAEGIALTTERLFRYPRIAELAAVLAEQPAPVPPSAQDAGSTDAPYPLTPLQQAMLFHSLDAARPGAYVSQFRFRVIGPLDAGRFQASCGALLRHHPVLTTAVHWEDQAHPAQRTDAAAVLPISWLDWSALSDAEARAAWDQYCDSDRQRGFTLSAAPLMRLALMRCADASHLCVWTHHHLLLDGWSQQHLLDELLRLYALGVDAPRAWPAEPSFRDYVDYVRRLAEQSGETAAEFWRFYLSGAEPTVVACDMAAEASGDYAVASRCLTPEQTTALGEFARGRAVTTNVLLQAAWALVLHALGGQSDVLFSTVASLRPDGLPGADRLVGLCLNTLPVRIRLPLGATLDAWVAELQRGAAEWHHYVHTPLPDILRHLAAGSRPLASFESLLVFENFLNGAAGVGKLTPLSVAELDFRVQESAPLVVVAVPAAAMQLLIKYDIGRFGVACAERIASLLVSALLNIVGGTGMTVGTTAERLAGESKAQQEHDRDTLRQADGARLAAARRNPRPVSGIEAPAIKSSMIEAATIPSRGETR